MKARRLVIGSLISITTWSCGGDSPTAIVAPETGVDVAQVEILATADDGLVLAWTTPGDRGRDVWVSTLDDGAFTPALVVSDVPAGDVPLEELRPSLAAAGSDRVAVAWVDHESDVRVAMSDDGGRSFAPSVRMNGDDGDALQLLPVIAFDSGGALHAVWIDPRVAPPQAEEPADLYHGRLDADGVTETNLTADQESSVCGCCRPHLAIDDASTRVTFRNTTAAGYRDPFQVVGTSDTAFSAPQSVSPPTWKIDACPVAGPIAAGRSVLWLDGSTGQRRLLASSGPEHPADVVFQPTADTTIGAAPRLVSGHDQVLALLPVEPASHLYRHEDGEWTAVADDLPEWATGAAVHDGQLVVVGVSDGRLMLESRPLPEI